MTKEEYKLYIHKHADLNHLNDNYVRQLLDLEIPLSQLTQSAASDSFSPISLSHPNLSSPSQASDFRGAQSSNQQQSFEDINSSSSDEEDTRRQEESDNDEVDSDEDDRVDVHPKKKLKVAVSHKRKRVSTKNYTDDSESD